MLNKKIFILITISTLPFNLEGACRIKFHTAHKEITPECTVATELVKLLDEALIKNKYDQPCSWEDTTGKKKISLTFEPYPNRLLPIKYRKASPVEAIALYSKRSALPPEILSNSDDQESIDTCNRDGSAPLLLQHYASLRHEKPLIPFLIKVSITGWHNLNDLSFLQNPLIDAVEHAGFCLLKTCMADLTVRNCGIKTLDKSTFAEYPNLFFLDLSNNSISTLITPDASDETTVPLMHLHTLNLSNNCITALGNFFTRDFQWLDILDLKNNWLQTIPASSLEGLITIGKINFSGNLLENSGLSIESFKGVASSRRFFSLIINLAENALIEFPPVSKVAYHLRQLDLSHNPLISCNPSFNYPCLNKVSIVRSEWPAGLKVTLLAQLKHSLGDSCRVLTDERATEELDGYTTP